MNGGRTNSAQAAAVRLSADQPPGPFLLPSIPQVRNTFACFYTHRTVQGHMHSRLCTLGSKGVEGRVIDLFGRMVVSGMIPYIE